MTEMMKAAVMYGPNDIRYEDVKKPLCPKDGFLLKVNAVGLCGSDIRNLTTDSCKGNYPYIYGHEEVGTIVELGTNYKGNFKLGDRVFCPRQVPCMECYNCLDGHTENCTNYYEKVGGFAEYVDVEGKVLKAGWAQKIPDDVDDALATLGEPLSSVYSCQRKLNIHFPDTVVIIGAGPIGCFHVALAKKRGASLVISIDIADNRLQTTKALGADYIINSKNEDPVAKVMEITNGRGVDHCISANPATIAQQQAIQMVKNGATATFFGGVPKGTLTPLDTNLIHYKNMYVYGHFGASVMDMINAYNLAIDPTFCGKQLVTHRMALKDINKALEIAKNGESIKIVLYPDESKIK